MNSFFILKPLLLIFLFSFSVFGHDDYLKTVNKKRNHTLLKKNLALGSSLLANLHMYRVFDDVNSRSGLYSDKDGHFAGGFLIGNLSSAVAQVLLPSGTKKKRLKSFWIGVSLSTLAGIVKEIRDSTGKGNVELEDAIATGLGGISGSIVISFADLQRFFK